MTQAPNFLVIQTDQLSASALAAYGNPVAKTPHLDALAARGTVFRNTYCTVPLCGPSRMSMMTGRLASEVQAYDNAAALSSEIPTFAHYLRARGYHTALSGKMHFVGPDQLHGFETRLTSDIYPADFYWTENRETRTTLTKSDPRGVTLSGVCKRSVQLDYDELTVFKAEQHLYDRARHRDQPFLAVVSLTHPHEPFYCTQDYWDLYDGVDIPPPAVAKQPAADQDPLTRYNMERYELDEDLNPEDIQRARRAYFGAVSYVDAQVGRLMAVLADLDLLDSTVVMFTSDHGEFLGERGLWFKRHFFDPAPAVPLIMAGPGVPEGVAKSENTSLADMLPTMLDMAGDPRMTSLCEPIDGRSLVPLMKGADWDNVAYGEVMSDGLDAPVFMVRRDDWKLIYGPQHPPQLYNLAQDPLETQDLAGSPDHTATRDALVAEADARWDAAQLQADIETSIARRLLVRTAHNQGKAPDWDHPGAPDEAGRWCRGGGDYNAWAFDVLQ